MQPGSEVPIQKLTSWWFRARRTRVRIDQKQKGQDFWNIPEMCTHSYACQVQRPGWLVTREADPGARSPGNWVKAAPLYSSRKPLALQLGHPWSHLPPALQCSSPRTCFLIPPSSTHTWADAVLTPSSLILFFRLSYHASHFSTMHLQVPPLFYSQNNLQTSIPQYSIIFPQMELISPRLMCGQSRWNLSPAQKAFSGYRIKRKAIWSGSTACQTARETVQELMPPSWGLDPHLVPAAGQEFCYLGCLPASAYPPGPHVWWPMALISLNRLSPTLSYRKPFKCHHGHQTYYQ